MDCFQALPWSAIGLLLLAGLALAVMAYGYGWVDGCDHTALKFKCVYPVHRR